MFLFIFLNQVGTEGKIKQKKNKLKKLAFINVPQCLEIIGFLY